MCPWDGRKAEVSDDVNGKWQLMCLGGGTHGELLTMTPPTALLYPRRLGLLSGGGCCQREEEKLNLLID